MLLLAKPHLAVPVTSEIVWRARDGRGATVVPTLTFGKVRELEPDRSRATTIKVVPPDSETIQCMTLRPLRSSKAAIDPALRRFLTAGLLTLRGLRPAGKFEPGAGPLRCFLERMRSTTQTQQRGREKGLRLPMTSTYCTSTGSPISYVHMYWSQGCHQAQDSGVDDALHGRSWSLEQPNGHPSHGAATLFGHADAHQAQVRHRPLNLSLI